MKIIPKPQETEIFEGEFRFADCYKISDEYKNVKNYIKTFVEVVSDSQNEIIFKKDESFFDEEYTILLDEEIVITSKDERGAFRAATTLKQLAFEKKVEKQKIHDYPDIKNRGIMLDISRGKIPNIETLYEIVDILGDLKYNQLQLYMESFVFEYEHFLEYCKDTMPLTVKEITNLKEYCNSKFIELVPNQNGFGHMGHWLKKDELKDLAIKREDEKPSATINPLDERSLELIDRIYSDLLPYFDSDFLNIGMDEPFELGMGQTKEACEKEGKGTIYVNYLNKVIDLARKKHNKTPMFWDDIVFKHSEKLCDIDKNGIFMTWGYEAEWPFKDRCRVLKENGLRFYTCPGTSTWGSVTGRFDNMLYNIDIAANACVIYEGEGFLLTDWGDGGHPQFFVMSILPYIYGAFSSWNYNGDKWVCEEKHAEHSHEASMKQSSVVRDMEDYADRFIFKGKKLSRSLHRMANYYHIENNEEYNGTCLWADINRILYKQFGEEIRINLEDYEMVEKYMQNIMEKLNSLDRDTPYIEEAKCNCNMVIEFVRFLESLLKNEKDTELIKDILALKEEFSRLWDKKNHAVGKDIFIKKLDDIVKYIESI